MYGNRSRLLESRTSLFELILTPIFVIYAFTLMLCRQRCLCFLLSTLVIISVSLTFRFLFSLLQQPAFPIHVRHGFTQIQRELLRKHLWLPPSLWLCSLPVVTTGPFEVMNEKWQFSLVGDTRTGHNQWAVFSLPALHFYDQKARSRPCNSFQQRSLRRESHNVTQWQYTFTKLV